MRVGINLGLVPAAAPLPYADLRDLAHRVERLGFDSLWIADHLLYRRPDRPSEPDTGPLEGWTTLTALGAEVGRLQLGPFVAAVPFRNPAVLAKMAVTLHEISGGRLVLGLGAGILEPEFRAFGIGFEDRFDRFEEALSVIASLLRSGRVDHRGRYYTLEDCVLVPPPPERGIPILVGGKGPRVLRLAARHADWWNGYWLRSPAEFDEHRARLLAACADVGRADRPVLTMSAYVAAEAAAGDVDSSLSGGPRRLASGIADYAAAGVDHLILRPVPQTADHLAAIAEAVDLSRS